MTRSRAGGICSDAGVMTPNAWFPAVRVPPLRGGPVLRWGVLAPGTIAGDFVATVRRNTDQRVTAVASRSIERGRRVADRHAVERVHESYEALVSDPGVDIVYVAAPHSRHARLGHLAISAGKHVLIEKPIATSARDAELGSARFLDPFVFPARFVVDAGGDRHEWEDTSGLTQRAGLAWQACAIAHYIDEGRTDSAAHSLDDAIGVLHTIDAVRAHLRRHTPPVESATDPQSEPR